MFLTLEAWYSKTAETQKIFNLFIKEQFTFYENNLLQFLHLRLNWQFFTRKRSIKNILFGDRACIGIFTARISQKVQMGLYFSKLNPEDLHEYRIRVNHQWVQPFFNEKLLECHLWRLVP